MLCLQYVFFLCQPCLAEVLSVKALVTKLQMSTALWSSTRGKCRGFDYTCVSLTLFLCIIDATIDLAMLCNSLYLYMALIFAYNTEFTVPLLMCNMITIMRQYIRNRLYLLVRHVILFHGFQQSDSYESCICGSKLANV